MNSFKPRTIVTPDFLVLFLIYKNDGALKLFVEDMFQEFDDFKNNVPPGEYKIDLVLDADNISGIKKTVVVWWSGGITDFHLELMD